MVALIVFMGIFWLIYMRFIEAGWIEITENEIPIPGLSTDFAGYRIAHISDIHMTGWMREARLRRIAEHVNTTQPDAIVITGDFVTRLIPYQPQELQNGLSVLQAPDGIFAVAGNHDYRSGIEEIRTIFATIGIRELNNDTCAIQRNGSHFWLCGVDDVATRHARLDLVMQQLEDASPAVLLVHEPDFADISAATDRFALQLSGHTHGGQIVFPLLGTLYKPRHGRLYRSGHYTIRQMHLYVTRGVGAVPVPIRFRCRPEISVHVLRPA